MTIPFPEPSGLPGHMKEEAVSSKTLRDANMIRDEDDTTPNNEKEGNLFDQTYPLNVEKDDSARSSSSTEIQDDDDVKVLKDIVGTFHKTCGECGSAVDMMDDIKNGSREFIAFYFCADCQGVTCGGCGEPPKRFSDVHVSPMQIKMLEQMIKQIKEAGIGETDPCYIEAMAGLMEAKAQHRLNECRKACRLVSSNYSISRPSRAINGGLPLHCQKGRLFAIWMLLSIYDEEETLRARPAKDSRLTPRKGNAKGTGYSEADSNWEMTSLSTDNDEVDDFWAVNKSVRAKNKDEEKSDALVTELLNTLSALLPIVDETTQCLIPEVVFFRQSVLLDRVAALIRNDSITDMTERRELYEAVFLFVRKLSDIPGMRELVIRSRLTKKGSPGLGALSLVNVKHADKLSYSPDTVPSILSCFQNVYKQAKIILSSADHQNQHPNSFQKPDQFSAISKESRLSFIATTKQVTNDESAAICKIIVNLYERLEKLMGKEEESSTEHRSSWAIFSEANRVTYTDDVLKEHRLYKKSPGGNFAAIGRMGIITRQLVVLMTSLPDGIFVKVSEAQSDVMKVLIIGVDGTPYGGGIFTFDMLLPLTYPKDPPAMVLALENADEGGQPMNPNLHRKSGQVCLSLLNTWFGNQAESWQPYKSTLLAVLVSVQSFILGTSNPYENEPSHAREGGGSQRAIKYNQKTERKVVTAAMISWLKKLVDKTPHIWRELTFKYFEYNADEVLASVKEREHLNPSLKHNRRLLENLLEESKFLHKKRKRDLVNDGEEECEPVKSVRKWKYGGENNMRAVRNACRDFNVQAARSLKDSIARMEYEVDKRSLAESSEGRKWGNKNTN